MKSPFEFRSHGQSGLPISSLFPHLSQFADDLCVIRSMHSDTAAHASGCLQMNTGSIFIGNPSLGVLAQLRPGLAQSKSSGFVVMTDPRGGPIGSASNWTAGYMPAAYQGTLFRSGDSPLLDLAHPPEPANRYRSASLDLLGQPRRTAFPESSRRIRTPRPHRIVRTRFPHARPPPPTSLIFPTNRKPPGKSTASTTPAPPTSAVSV